VTLKGHAKFTQKYENCRPPMSFGFTPIQNLGITFGYETGEYQCWVSYFKKLVTNYLFNSVIRLLY